MIATFAEGRLTADGLPRGDAGRRGAEPDRLRARARARPRPDARAPLGAADRRRRADVHAGDRLRLLEDARGDVPRLGARRGPARTSCGRSARSVPTSSSRDSPRTGTAATGTTPPRRSSPHEAFLAAGDPKRFPEQIAEGLAPWQPRRLFWNAWRRDGKPTAGAIPFELGRLQPAPRPVVHRDRGREPEPAQEPGLRLVRAPRAA